MVTMRVNGRDVTVDAEPDTPLLWVLREPLKLTVQQAWIDEQVPQCGYCQSGQIMSAIALLEKTPNPTDADIDAVMSANICRCGAYGRIRKAIKAAARA